MLRVDTHIDLVFDMVVVTGMVVEGVAKVALVVGTVVAVVMDMFGAK